jgi:hypothetical protein
MRELVDRHFPKTDTIRVVLEKPFTPDSLARTVREVLDALD